MKSLRKIQLNPSLRNYISMLLACYKQQLVIAFIIMLAVGITEGIGLMMLIPLLEMVGLPGAPQAPSTGALNNTLDWIFQNTGLTFSLASVLVIYVSFIGIQAYARRAADIRVMHIALGFIDHLRQKLYRTMSMTGWLFFAKQHTSDFNHVLTHDLARVQQGTHFLLRMSIASILILAYLSVSLFLSVTITLLTLLVGTGLLFILKPLNNKARLLGEGLTEKSQKLYNIISESFAGMKLAKIYGWEAKQTQTFEQQIDDVREQQLNFQRSSTIARMWFKLGAAAALAMLVYLAVTVLATPSTTLLVLILIFARLMPLLSELQQGYQQSLYMLPAFDAAMAMYKQCRDAQEVIHDPYDANVQLAPLHQHVELEQVCFHYDTTHSVLKGVNLRLPVCSTTAIIGPSGAGKSTLADLLVGLISPTSGELLVDGIAITDALIGAWRQQVAYVPQETFLFHESIRYNLSWPQSTVDDATLWTVLNMVAADDFVKALPNGLDTIVGERGVRLSGGERQRIAVARALLRKPKLLILDEATSALDTENERRLQHAIDALHGELTLVIIAHRLSTVRHADNIVVLDQGLIIEQGSWNSLTTTPDSYLQIVQTLLADQQTSNKISAGHANKSEGHHYEKPLI